MTTSPGPRKNQLLAALPEPELQRWLPHLEYVDMRLGEVLYEAGSILSHVYFPTTAIVSLLYVMQNGESAEIAVVGNDGVVGISLFMGGDSTYHGDNLSTWRPERPHHYFARMNADAGDDCEFVPPSSHYRRKTLNHRVPGGERCADT
jgi:CRP-like cAMP-binding protein